VAVSWTGYFLSLLDQFGIHLPAALVNAPLDGQLRPTGASPTCRPRPSCCC
jgi:APA family basic amino acid/polyamine antiporter